MPSFSPGIRREKSPLLPAVSTCNRCSESITLWADAVARLLFTDSMRPFSRSAFRERFLVGATDIIVFLLGLVANASRARPCRMSEHGLSVVGGLFKL